MMASLMWYQRSSRNKIEGASRSWRGGNMTKVRRLSHLFIMDLVEVGTIGMGAYDSTLIVRPPILMHTIICRSQLIQRFGW